MLPRSKRPRTAPFLLLLALIAFGIDAVAADTSERPNFVIILLDDASWEDFGPYGNEVVRTPVIDRLAGDGMRFERAFIATPSCSPSRAALLTARYPHATGAQELDAPLPADAVLLPAELGKAGYYTAAAGKWHLGDLVQNSFDRIYERGDNSGTANWLQALEERPRNRPFFLWLAATDPHRVFTAPEVHRPEDVVLPPYLADSPATRREYAQYYDEITRVDGRIGDFLAALAEQGVAKNTVVIFLADNGRPFPRSKVSLYDSGVRTPFIVRWPAKVKSGTVNPKLVNSIDIAPTLLELAGIERPPSFQGRSFAATLLDPAAPTQDYVILERNFHGAFAFERAVRTKDFLYKRNLHPVSSPCYLLYPTSSKAVADLVGRLMRYELTPAQQQCFAEPQPLEEFYDVRKDAHMLHNRVDDPENAETLARLRRILTAWSARTGDAINLGECGQRYRMPCKDVSAVEARIRALDERLGTQPGKP